MSKLSPHREFERQIERIHQLLELKGSEITWDDRIPDPDNPKQPRQIDIAIRRDGSLTIVECRLHREPQDVTWIEELMGRRTSLAADAVIAVSASGFTTTAREKATRYGIILRDFATLSRKEIQNWGRKWELKISYCEFSSVKCTITVDGTLKSGIPQITGLDGKPLNPIIWRLIFREIMHRLDQDKWHGSLVAFAGHWPARLLVQGKPPVAFELEGKVRRIFEDVSIVSVVAYADPISLKHHAEIGKFDLGKTKIIENCDETAMVIDVSQIEESRQLLF